MKQDLLCSVRVLDPEISTGRIFAHKTYRVIMVTLSTPSEVFEVRRRFSDFELLRNMLRSRYEGMVLVPLPPKGTLFSNPPADERLRGLGLFAERLARIPVLFLDTLTSAFFGRSGADTWELAVRNLRKNSKIDNPGLIHWEQLLSNVRLPEEESLERLAANMQQELAAASSAIAAVERAMEAAIVSAEAHATAMKALAKAMKSWHRVEVVPISNPTTSMLMMP